MDRLPGRHPYGRGDKREGRLKLLGIDLRFAYLYRILVSANRKNTKYI